MKKITFIALILMVCLGGTAPSLFTMEKGEEITNEHELSLKKPIFDVNHTTVPFQSSASWTFLKKNWVPIISFTVFTSYCLYDRQALPQALSWTKQCWQTLPGLFKGVISAVALYGGFKYLFSKQPLCNNPEHNRYVTLQMFGKYQLFLDQQLEFTQKMFENPNNILNLLTQNSSAGGFGGQFPSSSTSSTNQNSATTATGLPNQNDLGDLFNSAGNNKTKKPQNLASGEKPVEESVD